jgi:hypothetical protein
VGVVQVANADFAGGAVADGWVMQVVAIPEPGTWLLFGLGFSVMFAWGRRKR